MPICDQCCERYDERLGLTFIDDGKAYFFCWECVWWEKERRKADVILDAVAGGKRQGKINADGTVEAIVATHRGRQLTPVQVKVLQQAIKLINRFHNENEGRTLDGSTNALCEACNEVVEALHEAFPELDDDGVELTYGRA